MLTQPPRSFYNKYLRLCTLVGTWHCRLHFWPGLADCGHVWRDENRAAADFCLLSDGSEDQVADSTGKRVLEGRDRKRWLRIDKEVEHRIDRIPKHPDEVPEEDSDRKIPRNRKIFPGDEAENVEKGDAENLDCEDQLFPREYRSFLNGNLTISVRKVVCHQVNVAEYRNMSK